MKASVVSWFVGVSLLASTAHAQLFSEAKFGENFELDDYITEQKELSQVSPSLQWNRNPNVRQTSTTPQACYFVPGRLNTQRGFAVLSTERGSLIYELLASLGQLHSHSGMARGETSIRHNTMFTWKIVKERNELDIPVKLSGDSLRSGYPGTITHSVEAAMSHNEFNLADGLVLSSGPVLADLQRIVELWNADSEMEDFRGYYRLFAYTNMTWNDPYRRTSNDGNMCSGSIFHAHLQAGNRGWSWSQRRSYSTDVRQPAAALLYSQIRHKIVDEESSFLSALGLQVLDDLDGPFDPLDPFLPDVSTIAKRIANQVVNCMAFNDCNNTTPRWQEGVGSGRSVSPDDLYNLAFVAAWNAAAAKQPNTFAYAAATPLEKTGDYICCARVTQEPIGLGGPNVPWTNTQCIRNY